MTCNCNQVNCQWCGEFSNRGRGGGKTILGVLAIYFFGLLVGLFIGLGVLS